ncbi:MAG: Acg family FMN-binding oxidoreductase [Pseudonocardiaceae bacterium]
MRRTADLYTAVEQALRAPSVHNTQPWRWRIRPDAVELHADWHRHLRATDPDHRDLILSCGAALHHLTVALTAQGLAGKVDRLPDPENRGHLATVTIRHEQGDSADAALFPAICRRQTDRRRMSRRLVPADTLQTLTEQAHRAGALLVPVTGAAMRRRLSSAVTEAGRHQQSVPGYEAELELWTRRYAAGRDGIPAASIAPPPVGLTRPSPLRWFPRAQLRQPRQLPAEGPPDDAAELLVLATPDDELVDRLRAGEAISAVLLAATQRGLATTPLSQAIEVKSSRREIQQEVLRSTAHPQLIIRVGWPATGAAELPLTPRRDLSSILLPNRPTTRSGSRMQ